MDKDLLNRLTEKINEGLASTEEMDLFNAYMNSLSATDKNWAGLRQGGEAAVKEELWEGIAPALAEKKKTVKLWPRIAVAAAAIAVVVLGIWFYTSHHLEGSAATGDLLNYTKNDIAPGGNKATLTLANGRVISLSNAKAGVIVGSDLTYNDNSLVSAPSLVGYTRLKMNTPPGGTYQITLADGSKVWLNATSSISFPPSFKNLPVRKVELSGEAYFEVAKNKAQPFVVQSKGQEVTVLGTHFNVNSYGDEGSIKTTLLEGSVRVNGAVLKPGQQSVLIDNNIRIKQVDAEDYTAWKNGYFMFNQEPLGSIMLKLGRWYDVEFQLADKQLGNKTFNGTISRYRNISQVLRKLELTNTVHFKIEGKKIIVSP